MDLPSLDEVIVGAVVILATEGSATGASQQAWISVNALVVTDAAVFHWNTTVALLAHG